MKSYKLGRKSAHRKSTVKNLAVSVIIYERIATTLPKAKLAQRLVEKVMSRAKRYSTPNDYRVAKQLLGQDNAAKKIVEVLKQRYAKINSGFTRIVKLQNRRGDNALEVILELTIKTEAVPAKKDKTTKTDNKNQTTIKKSK